MRRALMASLATTASSVRPLVIMLHGSGDTGRGVEAWVSSLLPRDEFKAFDWEFPTAKIIPYTWRAARYLGRGDDDADGPGRDRSTTNGARVAATPDESR